MAITHKLKFTFNDGGGSPIPCEVAQQGSVEANLDAVVPGGAANQAFAVAIPASALASFFLVASQPATVRTNGVDEVQLLTPGGSPAAGDTYTLTFGGSTTASLPLDTATGAMVQAALEALAPVGTGGVVVSGPAGGPWTVRFAGPLGLQDVAPLTRVVATTHGATLTITTTTPGAAPSQTLGLAAGVPVLWHRDASWANPITADVAKLSVTVPGGATCQVKLRALSG